VEPNASCKITEPIQRPLDNNLFLANPNPPTQVGGFGFDGNLSNLQFVEDGC
jgi:hypothetical protein